METKLKKWGNGTGLLLKKELLQEIGASPGDVLNISDAVMGIFDYQKL